MASGKDFMADVSFTFFLRQLLFESAAKFNVSRNMGFDKKRRAGREVGEIKAQLQRVSRKSFAMLSLDPFDGS